MKSFQELDTEVGAYFTEELRLKNATLVLRGVLHVAQAQRRDPATANPWARRKARG